MGMLRGIGCGKDLKQHAGVRKGEVGETQAWCTVQTIHFFNPPEPCVLCKGSISAIQVIIVCSLSVVC